MTKKPRKKRPRTHITSPSHRVFRPYVAALGQLALAWNGLHETLALLYCEIVRTSKVVSQHLAVWHALKMDRAQRDILLAAATNNLFGIIPVAFDADIKWICNRADALEDARNDALHSPLWAYRRDVDKFTVLPGTGLGHIRAQKLAGKNLLAEFRWCRDRAISLSKFAAAMTDTLRDLERPWPDRPPWPKPRGTNEKSQPRRARPTKRQPPPRPSPG